ncbi:uncharacterized protein LOC113225121 isoform X2 [Piliocolobus tephrosceles]|uniref:uncharacterized protein LOC113225121 isoform X2 n=1 Tax=Piliocolobus tephrosceles TaxID=591936 RepID=UPI000E6B39A5|nr:uncharacterized protein LOC113225121 isoform X2 [Piliocolobus tephrosceles]
MKSAYLRARAPPLGPRGRSVTQVPLPLAAEGQEPGSATLPRPGPARSGPFLRPLPGLTPRTVGDEQPQRHGAAARPRT